MARAVGTFGSSQIAKWLEPNVDLARANFFLPFFAIRCQNNNIEKMVSEEIISEVIRRKKHTKLQVFLPYQ